jgi:hypothetical protein
MSGEDIQLERLRSEHTKTLGAEVIFGLATAVWLFVGFYMLVDLGTWFLVFVVLLFLSSILEYKRKRLARKIDVAEGVIAARRARR